MREAASEIRGCLERRRRPSRSTSPRRACRSSSTRRSGLLDAFVDLNNRVLDRLTDEERPGSASTRCPGGDQDSTHSAEDRLRRRCCRACSASTWPSFYVELASEADRERVLKVLGEHATGEPADLRRRHRPDRPARRDGRRGPRPGPRGGPVHRSEPSRHDRRLRLLAVRRRHLDVARHGVREDPGADRRARTMASHVLGRLSPTRRRLTVVGGQPPPPGGRTATFSQRPPVARRRTNVDANGADVRDRRVPGGVVGLLGHACPVESTAEAEAGLLAERREERRHRPRRCRSGRSTVVPVATARPGAGPASR